MKNGKICEELPEHDWQGRVINGENWPCCRKGNSALEKIKMNYKLSFTWFGEKMGVVCGRRRVLGGGGGIPGAPLSSTREFLLGQIHEHPQ